MTVDNASSNDTALGFFKKKLMSWGTFTVKIKYVHMRCIAHIFNLNVTEGLKEVGNSIKRVREAVRYIRNSPARLHKFNELAYLIGYESKCSLLPEILAPFGLYLKIFDSPAIFLVKLICLSVLH